MTPENDLIWMSAVIFTPALFALVLVFLPKVKDEVVRVVALIGTAATLGLSLCAFSSFRGAIVDFNLTDRDATLLDRRSADLEKAQLPTADSPQKTSHPSADWLTRRPWIEPFQIHYFLGADGISMAMVLLTTVISFLSMIASWGITKMVRGYCILFLLLETGMLGVFLALDFFLFFIFWEVMLLPMYFLIGIWGGPRREYAAIKFFLYTLLGGVFMLIAMLAFYFTDVRDFTDRAQGKEYHTFDIMLLAEVGQEASKIIDGKSEIYNKAKAELAKDPNNSALKEKVARLEQPFFTKGFQYTMFILLFVGFAIKLPMVPFHTWLPDAHVEAPTPISMILAGVLLKMGGYGFIRIAWPICPWAARELATTLAILGLVSLIYGAFAAMAQTDFKKLVAYSSVSHMGYVLLGMAVWPTNRAELWSWGMNGAMFQMIGHGVSSAGMFFMVGVIYDRVHHRNLDNFRGLNEPMPLYSGMSAVIFFAALGLPGLCGFVGEFMVVLSTWNYSKWMAVVAAIGVVFTAGYILWCLQRVFMGTNPVYRKELEGNDLTPREIACATPLVVLAVVLGILPGALVFSWMEPSVTGLVDTLFKLTPN